MTYVIAELGSVHDGSLGNALCLMQACAEAGANAVKLQDHRGEKIKGDPPWVNFSESREGYLKRTSFSHAHWVLIRERAMELGVDLVVSPFSVEAVTLLEPLAIDAYKIASGQVTNLPMLEAIGRTRRRVFLSSGMTTNSETGTAALMLGVPDMLHCTSEYPCSPLHVGLDVIKHWVAFRDASALVYRVGLSDHTLGMAASLAAIALGATVIERHVCFDRRGYGTDCQHSLTLDEFARFVREVRDLDTMLANPVDKDELARTPAMRKMRKAFLEVP